MMRIEAVYLPEFEMAVSWAMCRNPRCPNFGILFEGEPREGRKQVFDQRYAIEMGRDRQGGTFGKIQCRGCGQASGLASDRAVRPVARYYLGLSVPFADCPNEACDNHGANLFEHWGPWDGGQPVRYRREREHGAGCMPCIEAAESAGIPRPGPIVLGTARRTSYSPATRVRWAAILASLRDRRPGAGRVDLMGIKAASYYGGLRRIAARLRDYQAFRNARLWRPGLPGRDEPIALYTDVVRMAYGTADGHRPHMTLKVIVSAVDLGESAYVLAAHPYFLPGSLHQEIGSKAAGQGQAELHSDRACLEESFRGDPSRHAGRFIRSPYAELAHFLVVRKMLERFETVHHYMHSASELFHAAVIAWRDRILAGRPASIRTAERRSPPPGTVEIVLLQPGTTERRPPGQWLTRTPGMAATESAKTLLSKAALRPLDSIFHSVGLQPGPAQPEPVNAVGRGPRNRYYAPDIVYDELALCLLERNFVREQTGAATAPARAMGLIGPNDPEPDLVDLAWRFRLDTRHAERTSRWKTE